VALFTLHLEVRSGQWISRLGVVELAHGNCLPIGIVVALGTVRTQPSLMWILVAGSAGLRNSQKAARQVLHLDRRALRSRNMLGRMASSACYSGMFALENVTGELVIEGLGIPFDKRKILAIVFRVTAGALITRTGRNVVSGVESLMRGQPGCNFSVAVHASERGPGTELVTSGTVGCAVKRLVWPRKRTGRDLCPRRRQEAQQTKCSQGLEQQLSEPQRCGTVTRALSNSPHQLPGID